MSHEERDPREAVLERNVAELMRRAYVPARPRPVFRDELAETFVEEVRRAAAPTRAFPVRRMAVAAAWLGFLLVAAWAAWRSGAGAVSVPAESPSSTQVAGEPLGNEGTLAHPAGEPRDAEEPIARRESLAPPSPVTTGTTEQEAPEALARAVEDTPEPVLFGRVVDAESGRPVDAFRVALLEPKTENRFYAPRVDDFESPQGRFAVDEVPAGERLVFVHAEGFAVASLGLLDLRAPQELDVRLERGVSIRGRVVDAESRLPVADALVFSESDAPTQTLPFARPEEAVWLPNTTRTRPDGTFTLEHCSIGPHRLRASKDGFSVAWSEGLRPRGSGPLDAGELTLERGGSVSGRVTREDGTPWEDAQLVCVTMNQGQATMHFAVSRTDGDGRYAFEGLPPIVLLVVLSRGEETPWVRPVNVANGRETTVDFHSGSEGTRVTGTLFDGRGDPMRGQSLGIFDAQELAEGFSDQWVATATDDAGRFLFERVTPGEHLLFLVDESGLGLRFADRIVVGDVPTVEHDVHLDPGVIEGVVRAARTNAPVGSAIVTLERTDEGTDHFAGYRTTGPDGTFRFDDLRPGFYVVTAVPSGGSEGSELLGHERREEVLIDEFGWRSAVDFELEPGCEASVRVVDPEGAPLAYAEVFLIDDAGHEVAFSPTPLTNEDGRYHARGIRPGTYRVSARLEGHRATGRPTIECRPDRPARAEVTCTPHPHRTDRR